IQVARISQRLVGGGEGRGQYYDIGVGVLSGKICRLEESYIASGVHAGGPLVFEVRFIPHLDSRYAALIARYERVDEAPEVLYMTERRRGLGVAAQVGLHRFGHIVVGSRPFRRAVYAGDDAEAALLGHFHYLI